MKELHPVNPYAYPLKKGDKVVMHTCIEAEQNHSKIWQCAGDSWNSEGSEKVMLYGFSGSFLCCHLQVVKFDPLVHFAENDIERIIMTVQDNSEMFSAKIGDSCLKAAADYLEKKSDTLVTE